MPIPSLLPTSSRCIRRPRVSPPGTVPLTTTTAITQVAAGDAGMTRDLAARLQHARESERAALARELHDELGAILHEDGKAELNCHFCNETYRVEAPELEDLIAELSSPTG